jgi:predicted nucleic acid-binding protein
VIVVDASIIVHLLLATPIGRLADTRLQRHRYALHAPHLLDLETAQVLRRYERARKLTATRALEALRVLADLGLRRYPHDALLPRIWELRFNLGAYDAAYVALAEALDVPLLTTDRKLAQATGHRARIELLA